MSSPRNIAIIGAGPAGLMAAEVLAEAGCKVTVYDRMSTPGRKFLMAGRGGLNLTHSEPLETFLPRYGSAAEWLAPHIKNFPPEALRAWCESLGQTTFVGSSGRIFPTEMKASPLLRAWLRKLDVLGVIFQPHHQWMGWNEQGELLFKGPKDASITINPSATLLALGGASWPHLGSDGGWVTLLEEKEIKVSPLRPSNCGFAVRWSETMRQRYAGQPVKPLRAIFGDRSIRGEAMITEAGIEGSTIYALSPVLRDAITKNDIATLHLDLRPDLSPEALTKRLETPQRGQSRSTFLRKAAGMSPVAISLVQEVLHKNPQAAASPQQLASLIKALPLTLTAPFPIARAISSAGGISRNSIDENFMLIKKPGLFAAGEMLDWEAPTGGYLLQACFSTGKAAAKGILRWLKSKE